jgi:hypothetical protein
MTNREKHNIESNCVSFDDECFNETVSHADTRATVEDIKQNLTGEQFVKYLKEKLVVRNG